MCHALLLALTLLHPLATSAAQPLTGKISGTVVVGDMPLPGALITVTYAGAARTTVTDNEGAFGFGGIPLGAIVQLSAEMESFKPQKRTVALTAAAASRDFTFAMKFREGEGTYIVAVPPSAVEEPNTYHVLQRDIDNLPIGRALDDILDLLPGTH